jgi:hypothetical protein
MRGHVVIAGLGMGLALYNALLRPTVRRVTVLDRDPEVVALFEAIRDPDWPCADRFRIEQADARIWRLPAPVDYLYADIWENSAPRKPPPTRARCAATCGRNRPVIGGWKPISSPSSPTTGAGRR